VSGRKALQAIYRQLFEQYGPQHWWPAESRFEVMVGAVLTQNTAWINVERAIGNLRQADLLTPASIASLAPQELADYLRPAGYFNVKARRLQAFCTYLLEHDDLDELGTQALRESLLSVHGIGPETADDMLLYAFQRPVFVIDAYTRRLFGRLGLMDAGASYETLRAEFERALGREVALFNEYHALIVNHAKHVCRKKPDCEGCCLRTGCAQRI
jgi:endonuclease III related protein